MAEIILSVTKYDDPEIMLVGEISRAGESTPAVKGPVVVKPTQAARVQLDKGVYIYELNVNRTGQFTVVAKSPPAPDQIRLFDTAIGGQIGRAFRFEVRS